VIVQHHADEPVQTVIGSDVELWGVLEQMAEATPALIVNVGIHQFDGDTLGEEKVGQRGNEGGFPSAALCPFGKDDLLSISLFSIGLIHVVIGL
jgi:hypothetical protein